MNAKENTIEKTLNALEGIQRVEVPFVLNEKLKRDFKVKKSKMSTTQKWMIAASIMVLLGANLVTIVAYSKTKSTEIASTDNQKNIVYKEYFSSEY